MNLSILIQIESSIIVLQYIQRSAFVCLSIPLYSKYLFLFKYQLPPVNTRCPSIDPHRFVSYKQSLHIFVSSILMQKDEQHDSSEEEGFYKPALKVVKSIDEPHPPQLVNQQTWQAKDLFSHTRPTDLQPRTLTTAPPLHKLPVFVHALGDRQQQQLRNQPRQKTKKCKYLSLKDKYHNNALFQLVYSKIQPPQDFNSYIFSLNHTTDYHPVDYQLPTSHEPANPFDSRFESGNLLQAYLSLEQKSVETLQYDLILQNDTNTRGYNHWFFFSYANGNQTSVRFNIVNLIKKHSLFEEGVRPVGLSMLNPEKGWHSVGSNIDYQKSFVSREILTNPPTYKNYYTLSFTLNLPNPNDRYYLALNYPYPYSRMTAFLDKLTLHPNQIIVQQQILCHTISNNAIPALRIKHQDYHGNKKILVMGRQHPGETVGSFVLQGFLKKIINQQKILQTYQIIAIPMVNPDGVIYGNFRTNLAGFDLNRQWTDPDRWMHPEIYAISRFIQSLDNLAFVLDFHGHSKKLNSFIFACNGQPSYPFRVFPYIFGNTSPFFSIKDCTYSLTADKERTARIKLYNILKKPQVFTLQTSFFGYQGSNGKKYRLKIQDLFQIGEGAVESLKTYLLRKKQTHQFQKQVKEKQYLFDQWALQNKDGIQSQSNPSQDQLTPVQRKQKVIAQKQPKKSKAKKKPSKSTNHSIMNLSKHKNKVQTEQKHQSLFGKTIKLPAPHSTIDPVQIIKKKVQSEKAIPIKDIKVRTRKVDKAVSIITPNIPKPSSRSKVPPLAAQYNPITPDQKHISIQPATQRKTEGDIKKLSMTSNLFSKPSYFTHLQDQLQKRQNPNNLHNKTQSLQINSVKKQTHLSGINTMDLIRRLVSAQQEDIRQPKVQQMRRQRQKLYAIRQNRIINSMARLNQQQMKKNLEEQINLRTQALKNCQRKMRQITSDQPILHNPINFLTPTNFDTPARPFETQLNKSSKFPALKLERKSDYFNF